MTRMMRLDLGDDWMAPVWRKTPLEAPKARKHVATAASRAVEEEAARRAEERRRAKREGEMPARELIAIRERYGLSWTRLAQVMGCSASSVTSYAKSGPVPGPRAKSLRAWIVEQDQHIATAQREIGALQAEAVLGLMAEHPRMTRRWGHNRKPTPPEPVAHSDEARALLTRWQITPRDLADRLGVSQAAASAWISGRREISPTRRRQIIAWLT